MKIHGKGGFKGQHTSGGTHLDGKNTTWTQHHGFLREFSGKMSAYHGPYLLDCSAIFKITTQKHGLRNMMQSAVLVSTQL